MTRSADPISPEIASGIMLVCFGVDRVLPDAGVYSGASVNREK